MKLLRIGFLYKAGKNQNYNKLLDIISSRSNIVTKAKKDFSCGGIVYFIDKNSNNNKSPLFLILEHLPGKHWDIPKGHPEVGETFEETAKREIVEESGIRYDQLKFITKLEHKNHYSFYTKRGILIHKTVHLFLCQSFTDTIVLSHAHSDYKWVPANEIATTLTFDTSIPAFKETFTILDNKS